MSTTVLDLFVRVHEAVDQMNRAVIPTASLRPDAHAVLAALAKTLLFQIEFAEKMGVNTPAFHVAVKNARKVALDVQAFTDRKKQEN